MNHGGPFTRLHVGDCLLHGIPRIDHIGAVAVDDLQVAETAEVVAHARVCVHLLDRDGDSVPVVLDHKDDRILAGGGAVDGLVVVAFGRGRFAAGAEDHGIGLVILHRLPKPGGLRGLVAGAARSVLDVQFRFCEVVRHVAPSPCDIRIFRESVQDNLVGSDARGKAGHQVAIVGEQIILFLTEGLAQRKLDSLMAGAGGVIAPPLRLLQVVRRLVVQQTSQVHELVPLQKRGVVRTGGGNGGFRGGASCGGFGRAPGLCRSLALGFALLYCSVLCRFSRSFGRCGLRRFGGTLCRCGLCRGGFCRCGFLPLDLCRSGNLLVPRRLASPSRCRRRCGGRARRLCSVRLRLFCSLARSGSFFNPRFCGSFLCAHVRYRLSLI